MRVSAILVVSAAFVSLAAPALGQITSEAKEFLDAVRKNDSTALLQILDEPGQTIIDTRDRDNGESALHILAHKNTDANLRFMRFILAKKANPNSQDASGNTAAYIAVQNSFGGAIDALTDYHADFNLANRRGETPLIMAVHLRNLALMRKLLDAGADPDRADSLQGYSARDYARQDSRTPALMKLLEEYDARAKSKPDVAGPTL